MYIVLQSFLINDNYHYYYYHRGYYFIYIFNGHSFYEWPDH